MVQPGGRTTEPKGEISAQDEEDLLPLKAVQARGVCLGTNERSDSGG